MYANLFWLQDVRMSGVLVHCRLKVIDNVLKRRRERESLIVCVCVCVCVCACVFYCSLNSVYGLTIFITRPRLPLSGSPKERRETE